MAAAGAPEGLIVPHQRWVNSIGHRQPHEIRPVGPDPDARRVNTVVSWEGLLWVGTQSGLFTADAEGMVQRRAEGNWTPRAPPPSPAWSISGCPPGDVNGFLWLEDGRVLLLTSDGLGWVGEAALAQGR